MSNALLFLSINKNPQIFRPRVQFVRMEGLEPPCPEALDPKSSASTNFATSAGCFEMDCKGIGIPFEVNKLFAYFFNTYNLTSS